MTKLRSQKFSFREALCHPERTIRDSANHRDSSGLARSLALSFSRVAAARRIPVLPHFLQQNSGFLARARHAPGNDRKIRPSGRACHYRVQDSNRSLARSLQVRQPPLKRSLARSVTGEGKRRGGCCLFCNRRDARVRVQRGLASRVASIFFSEFLTEDAGGVLRNPRIIEMAHLPLSTLLHKNWLRS